ncbi:hypothetical protein [uncultured Roseobacter sp.]|uniref:hypothetical protein n=1 Tax=uncultured Roseobacter sp. TaxID=114847 RepID=UPI002621CDF9|nr:hypothetical protein [uncultured Roseobacter sp.]
METRKKTYSPILMALAVISLSACDGNADSDALIGNWAASQSDCGTEWLALTEEGDDRAVQWWRTTDEATGPLPWRSGSWELRDSTVIMSFDHRVEYRRFTQTRIDEPIDETVQFDVQDAGDDELRLAATAGGFSPEALLLGGEERVFIRCEG